VINFKSRTERGFCALVIGDATEKLLHASNKENHVVPQDKIRIKRGDKKKFLKFANIFLP
jgi:hypothetical protein